MVLIIVADKCGNISNIEYNDITINNLYKKCRFRKVDNFEERVRWNKNKFKWNGKIEHISVFARDKGKHTIINKYELPPPVDTTLFYGNIAIVAFDKNNTLLNLSEEFWEKTYELLFGGFEDLSATISDDEKESDELDDLPDEIKTKHGYLKDGFVVEDKSFSDNVSESESEEHNNNNNNNYNVNDSDLDVEEYELLTDND